MQDWPNIATANRACSLLYSFIKDHAEGIWLLPVNVCPDVPLTFCLAKVTFRFVDINLDTLCVDLDAAESIIRESPSDYAGLLFVRTYGFITDTSQEFERIRKVKKDLLIIDDRCLCVPERHPQFWNADMLLYSTGHCKQIDLGGGGLAFYKEKNSYTIDPLLRFDGTDEEALYKEAFRLGVPLPAIPEGWLKMDFYESFDEYFSRIDNAIPERETLRASINHVYSSSLPPFIQLRPSFQSWRFNILVKPRHKDRILKKLFENGLFASSHYHSVNKLFDYQEYECSDSLNKGIINLFNDKYYSLEMAVKTCNIIYGIIKGTL